MAKSNCLGCGRELDSSAKTCPYCGRENPTPESMGEAGCMGIIVLIVVIAMVIFWFS